MACLKRIVYIYIISLFYAGQSVLATRYSNSSKVDVYVNKVGPFYNPHETYHYYKLPVCRPEIIIPKVLTLGEVLDGDRMAMSNYDILFKTDEQNKLLCKKTLSNEDISLFRDAIEELYYFEFVIDDIPVRGFVGRLEETGILPHSHKIALWTHILFNIHHNEDQIVYVNVSMKEKAPQSLDNVMGPLEVQFTYSVKWQPSEIKVADRMKGARDGSFFPKSLEIHWLSVLNSTVLVILLTVFVVIILARIVNNDFVRYNVHDKTVTSADVEDEEEDNGWKIIHGDVFRFPPCRTLFCAILGVGTQFLILSTAILCMALLGMFNVHNHGSINIAAILLYLITSFVSGYVAVSMYEQMGGENWMRTVNVTSTLFTAPFFIIWSIVNTVAWGYGSTQALPFGTVVMLIAFWILAVYPLTIVGAYVARKMPCSFNAPSSTRSVAHVIPSVAWYRTAPVQCIIGGFLPFSAISVELYYIFATVWGREAYTLYGILFIIYAILLLVTACISVSLTYFQLSVEDHHWWWRSLFTAGSTGFFVFIYAVFYYFKRSNMFGTLQMIEFFGYTSLVCYAFFLMLGTLSFFSSLKFVRYIYANIKMD